MDTSDWLLRTDFTKEYVPIQANNTLCASIFLFPFFWQGWDTAHYQTGHTRRWWSRPSVIKLLTEARWTRKPNVLYLSFRRTNQRWFFLSYLIPSKKGLYFVCTGSTERQRKILFKPLYVDYKMVFSHPFGELSFTGRRTRDSKEASLSKLIANIQCKLNTYRHVVPPYLQINSLQWYSSSTKRTLLDHY